MSKKLLEALNGNNRGPFWSWHEAHPDARIAWYPSAGGDLRDLLYLSPEYASLAGLPVRDMPTPDIFLHMDVANHWGISFHSGQVLLDDGRTSMTVLRAEELPALDLRVDPGMIRSPDREASSGRVFYLEVEVCSSRLGAWRTPMLYAFAENAAFCAEVMLRNGARASHVVHVRHGGGCGGGGTASGAWIRGVVGDLDCHVFITDGHCAPQSGDRRALELYPELAAEPPGRFIKIHGLPGRSWSDHGDVTWYRIRGRRQPRCRPSDGFIRPGLLDICRELGEDIQRSIEKVRRRAERGAGIRGETEVYHGAKS